MIIVIFTRNLSPNDFNKFYAYFCFFAQTLLETEGFLRKRNLGIIYSRAQCPLKIKSMLYRNEGKWGSMSRQTNFPVKS